MKWAGVKIERNAYCVTSVYMLIAVTLQRLLWDRTQITVLLYKYICISTITGKTGRGCMHAVKLE